MSNSVKLLRINDVIDKTTLGKSTIWVRISQGKFPKPVKLSPAISVWKESDIDDWINSLFISNCESDLGIEPLKTNSSPQ